MCFIHGTKAPGHFEATMAWRVPLGFIHGTKVPGHSEATMTWRVTLYSIHWTKGVPGGTSCPVTVSITRTQLSRSVHST